MSTSRVRGPHRTVRTRFAADSSRWHTPSSWRGVRSVSISTTMFRNGFWPPGPPTGWVRYTGDTATTPESERDRLPQQPPAVTEVRAQPQQRPGHGRSRVIRTPEVAITCGTGGRCLRTETVTERGPGVGEHDVGHPLRQPLQQHEPLGGDDLLDGAGQRAVVEGVTEVVGGPRRGQVGHHVEVDLQRLAALLLLGERPAVAAGHEAAKLDPVGRCHVRVVWVVVHQSRGGGRVAASATSSRPSGPSWRWVSRSTTVTVLGAESTRPLHSR